MYPRIVWGAWTLSSYNLFAFVGALTVIVLVWKPLGSRGLSVGSRMLLLLSMCLAFLAGARLWNAAVNPFEYVGDFHWYTLKMRGLSLYGGLTGSMAVLGIYCLFTRTKVLPLLDDFTFPGAAAFCISRVGCFLNGCCAGKITDAWYGVVFPSREAAYSNLNEMLPLFHSNNPAVHPTQLYELFGALAGIILVWLLCRWLQPGNGGRFFLYIAWFSAIRLSVLPLRSLSYLSGVKEIAYPVLYSSIILCGVVMFWKSVQKKVMNENRAEH